ncbi:hypothetical protein MSIBF_A1770009 [groundwater metagenome]|uniref:Methyltransferase domain-containing protein n=1 Tax=groundwater metagenome TaxID=717931 RepID=A0A098EAA4_9ZZZZ
MKYKKFLKKIITDDIGYESATPDIVANFLAKDISERLSDLGITNINIIDCCCGIGNDALALSKVCNFVVAVDNDKERLKIAEKNAKISLCKNIKFICEDVLNLDLKNLKNECGLNAAFADPQRRLMIEGKFKRTNNLPETSPNTINLINFIRAEIPDMCILASSNADVSNLNLNCEREYISWEGRKGKRETLLAMYFGNLKRCNVSAVVLPGSNRIYGTGSKNNESENNEKFSDKPQKYLYEIKDCVVKAGLRNDLAKLTECKIFNAKFLTSEKIEESSFFENGFKILGICDKENLIENLKKINARKIVIRGKISPEEYTKMKNEIEYTLAKFNGKEKIHIFLDDKNDKILTGKCIYPNKI